MSSPHSAPPAVDVPDAAVVIAHGPTGATLTSLNRLRDLLGPRAQIVVTAGLDLGLTSVERAAERGFETVTDHGPDAVAAALGQVSADPVLVMHDDVELTAAALTAMAKSHVSSGATAVPSGRDGGRARTVEQAELTCALGSPAALSELASTSGFGPGHVVAGEFVAAPASVRHRSDCRDRLIDPLRVAGSPLLVAGLIVRDEEDNIADCLASLDGVVDRIEVVDTGSMDDTVAVAREHGANVVEVAWCDDFAHARNAVLDRCRDATFMVWIDADERLSCSDVPRFRQVLHTYRRLYPSYRVEIHNLADGIETHSFWAKRIIRTAGVHFEGAIHEQARSICGEALLDVPSRLCSIEHRGYADAVMARRDKLARNLRIAKDSFDRDQSAERAIHYARALEAASEDPVSTLARFEPLLDLVHDAPRPIRAMVEALRAKLLLEGGRVDEAATVASAAATLVPADPVAGAVLAEALVRLGRHDEALDTAEHYAALPSPDPAIDDRVAASSRAAALFQAAVSVGRLDDAVQLVPHLAPDVDPWVALAGQVALDTLVGLAAEAGARSDVRYLHSLVTRRDLTCDLLDTAQRSYLGAGGELADEGVVGAARADLARADEAPDLRLRFEQSGSADDALAYATAAVAGHVDLALELDGIGGHEHVTALALGIAAEALARRGRDEDAVADAILAVGAWPGCLRAVNVVARAATASGMADVALDLIAGARATGVGDTAPRARRHELVNRAVDAHVSSGDLPSAVTEALVVVEEGGALDGWAALLEAAVEDTERMTLVLSLALLGDGDDFLTAAAVNLGTDKTAELCAAYLVSGGRNPEAVTMGIVAATLSELTELADVTADHASLLDVESRERLAAHLSASGASELAGRIGLVGSGR